MGDDQSRKAAKVRPCLEEVDRGAKVGVGFGMAQALFLRLNIPEIRQHFQIFSQATCIKGLLEGGPKMGLQVINLARPLQAILIDFIQFMSGCSKGFSVFGGAGAMDDDKGFVQPPGIDQAAGNVGGDGALGQLFGGIARHIGIHIALQIGDIGKDDRGGA